MLIENIFLLVGLSVLALIVTCVWSIVLLASPSYGLQTKTAKRMIFILILLVDVCVFIGISGLYVHETMLDASIFYPIAIIPATMAHAALDGNILGQGLKEFRVSLGHAMHTNRWIVVGLLVVFTGEVGYPDDNVMFAYLVGSLVYAMFMYYLCVILMTRANASHRNR